jgi:hypothetical protein
VGSTHPNTAVAATAIVAWLGFIDGELDVACPQRLAFNARGDNLGIRQLKIAP